MQNYPDDKYWFPDISPSIRPSGANNNYSKTIADGHNRTIGMPTKLS